MTAVARTGAAQRSTVRATRFGWVLFSASIALTAVAIGLDVRASDYRTFLYITPVPVLALLGLTLTTRRPEHPVSWILAGFAVWSSIAAVLHGYAAVALVSDPGTLPAGLAAAWVDNWGWLPSIALPIGLLLVMPDGRLLSSRWRLVAAALVAGTVLAAFAISTSDTFEVGSTMVDNPYAPSGFWTCVAGIPGFTLLIAAIVGSLACLVIRFRRSEGDERQQLRWVGLSLVVSLVLGIVGSVLWDFVPGAQVLPALAFLALPAGIAVAILRYRLYAIDLIINRTLVYGLLTIVVIGGYALAVGLVGALVSARSGFVVSLVATGVVAVSFQPLRARAQRVVNRLTYGERDEPYTAIARLGRRLEGALHPDAVLSTIVDTIGDTLALDYVAIAETPETAAGEAAAEFGSASEPAIAFPLVHQGRQVGELRLSPRPGERLRERDRRLIEDLAPQVAAAVHAVGLTEELRVARQRVVELREEERRRIRRDLHDGLGPALAGLTFTLEAARNVAVTDLARADQLLGTATEQLQTMIGDIRKLIYGLRPPTLDELGLAASLRGLGERAAMPKTEVSVHARDPLPPLPAAVEVAAYWITQEALTNVKRHANARVCDVRLQVESGLLQLEIEDDGQGLAQATTGIGLHSMQERAAEVGGTCVVHSRGDGRGTRVIATLPRAILAEAP